MKNLIKILAAGAFMMTIFVASVEVAPQVVEANGIFNGKKIDDNAAIGNPESRNIVEKIFGFANIFAGIVLAISIVMIILGGLRYILASGDQRAAEQGKLILIYSAIGILIALSAFALGRFFSGFAV